MLATAVFAVVLGMSSGSTGGKIVLAAVMFLFLLGFGYLFDNWFYKRRLRRWERKRAGG